MSLKGERLQGVCTVLAIGVFGVSGMLAQGGGGEEEEATLSCSHIALCSTAAPVPCDEGASVSCCRPSPSGTWSCKCCDTSFDCLNTPGTWQCNDVTAGG